MRVLTAVVLTAVLLAWAAPVLAEDPQGSAAIQQFTWTGTVVQLEDGGDIVFDVDHIYADGPPPGIPGGRWAAAAGSALDRNINASLQLRADFGLPADLDYVCRLASDPVNFSEDWGWILTPQEAADLAARLTVQHAVSGAAAWAMQQSSYVAVFFDQRNGGIPVFVFSRDVDQMRAELEGMIPDGIDFEVRAVDTQQLKALKDRIWAERAELQASGVEVLDTEVDSVGRVNVLVANDSTVVRELLEARYPGVHVYAEAPRVPPFAVGQALRLNNDSCSPITGLQVGRRYLVSTTVNTRPFPPRLAAVWELRFGDRAQLVYMYPSDRADADAIDAASTLEEALSVIDSMAFLPDTDMAVPAKPEPPPSIPVSLVIGALVGLLVLLHPKRPPATT